MLKVAEGGGEGNTGAFQASGLISKPKLKSLGDSGKWAFGGGREGGGVMGEVAGRMEGGTGESNRGSWTTETPFGSVKDSEGLTTCLADLDEQEEEGGTVGAGA